MTVWLQIWGMILHGLFAQALPFPGPGSYPSVLPPPLSGMQIWWEADVGNNCSGACTDGASQTTWADQSGNSNNGTLTPVIVSACVASVYHTNQINGKPAVQFNNTAGPNATCFARGSSGTPIAWSGEITEFVVETATTNSHTIAAAGANSFQWQVSSVKMQGASKATATSIGTGSTNYSSAWHQLNVTYKSSTGAWAFRMDRGADGSGTNAQTIASSFLTLGMSPNFGGTETFNGFIAEFILYNRVLSGSEITTVETYLNSKYGL